MCNTTNTEIIFFFFCSRSFTWFFHSLTFCMFCLIFFDTVGQIRFTILLVVCFRRYTSYFHSLTDCMFCLIFFDTVGQIRFTILLFLSFWPNTSYFLTDCWRTFTKDYKIWKEARDAGLHYFIEKFRARCTLGNVHFSTYNTRKKWRCRKPPNYTSHARILWTPQARLRIYVLYTYQ